ncbi:MAG: hypothetical protein E6767_04295 [Dysgonomonas sp.]|nr:hypothetical protein [Dysgonomonas sp.]
MNNVAYSYTGNEINVEGGLEIFSDMGYSLGNFGGTAELPKNVSFIPPKTMISHIPLRLEVNFEGIDKKKYRNGHMGDKEHNAVKVKRVDFEEEASPLQFRSYLTIYEKPEKPMVFEQSFYISTLIKTRDINPKNLSVNVVDRGDFFYVEKPANNTFWEVLGIATVTVGVVALDVVVDANSRY